MGFSSESTGSRVVVLEPSCPTARGILVSWPGMEHASPALEAEFPTTGPPGKFFSVGFWFFPQWLSGKESACNAGDIGHMGSIPWSGRSPGEGNGNSLQYSCLGNPMGRGAWQDIAYGVTKRGTWLSIHTQTHIGHEEPNLIRCSLTFQFSGIPILL